MEKTSIDKIINQPVIYQLIDILKEKGSEYYGP
jgi:hypothetical protein